MKRTTITKIALCCSICLMIFWAILGTGTSIAWFMDESPTAINTFDIGELNLVVSHKVGNDYKEIKDDTKIFNQEALYEPGYVEVVYLKIENKGNVDFDYKLSVVPDLNSVVTAKNAYGQDIYLPEHLEFGLVLANSEAEVIQMVKDRQTAEQNAELPLDEYSALNTYDSAAHNLKVGGEKYAALILRMPKEVNNVANYRGETPPSVELGLTVKATQEGTAF